MFTSWIRDGTIYLSVKLHKPPIVRFSTSVTKKNSSGYAKTFRSLLRRKRTVTSISTVLTCHSPCERRSHLPQFAWISASPISCFSGFRKIQIGYVNIKFSPQKCRSLSRLQCSCCAHNSSSRNLRAPFASDTSCPFSTAQR